MVAVEDEIESKQQMIRAIQLNPMKTKEEVSAELFDSTNVAAPLKDFNLILQDL